MVAAQKLILCYLSNAFAKARRSGAAGGIWPHFSQNNPELTTPAHAALR